MVKCLCILRDISFLRDAISAQKKVSLLSPVADLGSVQKASSIRGQRESFVLLRTQMMKSSICRRACENGAL